MNRLAIAVSLALCGAAHADVLVNGDFESMPNWGAGIAGDGGYTLLIANAIPGWTIEANHGATIHNTSIYPYISGNYSLNTDGEGWSGHNVDMYQDFATLAGQQYSLSFDWKNWYSASTPLLDVSVVDTVTNAVLAHGSYGVDAGLHSESFDFVGSGNAFRLRVKCDPESGYNDNTFIVDNFAVNVPTPAGLAMIGIGGMLAGRRRR